jgi:transcriptional regulator with XRE-family HTH domain
VFCGALKKSNKNQPDKAKIAPDGMDFLQGIGERFSKIMSEFGVARISKETGMSQSAIWNYTHGLRSPNLGTLSRLSDVFDIDLNWLATGEGAMYRAGNAPRTTVPLLDIPASAGHGTLIFEEPDSTPVCINPVWLWENYKLRPKDVCAVTVKGSSMEKTLQDGDMVLVNRAFQHGPGAVYKDGIWVFRFDGHIAVKRLVFAGDRIVEAHSENKAYPTQTIDWGRLPHGEFEPIGMVFAIYLREIKRGEET